MMTRRHVSQDKLDEAPYEVMTSEGMKGLMLLDLDDYADHLVDAGERRSNLIHDEVIMNSSVIHYELIMNSL